MEKSIFNDLPNSTEITQIYLKGVKEGKTLGEIQLQYLSLHNAEEIFKILIEQDQSIYWRCIPEIIKFPQGKALFKTYLENDHILISQIIGKTLETIFSLPDAAEFLEIYLENDGFIPAKYKKKLLEQPNLKHLAERYKNILSSNF